MKLKRSTRIGADAITSRRETAKSKALDAFLAAKSEIDMMLARLAALSANHFEANPDEVNWDHVATMSQYRNRLREITNCAFKEGEHSD